MKWRRKICKKERIIEGGAQKYQAKPLLKPS